MESEKLLKELSYLGLPLLEVEEYVDVNKALSDVVKSENVRLWESFPLLLVNANRKNEFRYTEVEASLQRHLERAKFERLFLLSLAFYRYQHLRFGWAKKAYYGLASSGKEEYNNLLDSFRKKKEVVVFRRRLDLKRMKQVFDNYFEKGEASTQKLRVKRENLGLEYALSQLFTPRQKELFLKKFKGEKMTKTEKEYFSRVVKKKVLALANPEVHRLAQQFVTKF